ncbi:PD-(D/E)XK nuclease family protein [Bifidobacterium sp. ESL0784]|uniref:PD-(D/E)XK nuclease family protein n=1 Tax=Bifidobacterium sp. ESL0784 TaxID=2983231 RepID=UPI0023F73121|nr:PD-(D/E)XK nuclease family protein [Bifidobacterium sp. ESL0784]MDF7641744.1 PD-(D/E)XK nuclease family protein [Bifidobacterium sp. ESL0784]
MSKTTGSADSAVLAVAKARQQKQQPVKQEAQVSGDDTVLWPRIRAVIENAIVNNPRSLQKTIGPSELGTDSLHTLAAKLAGWPHPEQPNWATYVGTSVHAQLQGLFDSLNEVKDEQEQNMLDTMFGRFRDYKRFLTEEKVTVGHLEGLYGGYDVTGSIDLYIPGCATIIDWKNVGTTTAKTVKANGVSQQYRVQVSLYGLGIRNADLPVEWVSDIFLPRTGLSLNDTVPRRWPFDPKPGQWALARAQLLVNLMDVIEQTDGPEMRDAWISLLPESPTHDFNDGTWPDSDQLGLGIDEKPRPEVPEKWRQLIPLLEPTYQPQPTK